MKAVIVTEGFKGTGYGHLTRCLSIYQAFEERGITPTYIANCDETGRNFVGDVNLISLDWASEMKQLFDLSIGSDLLVIDSYLADYSVYEGLQGRTGQIGYIDDYIRMDYPPGIIINGTVGAETLPYVRLEKHKYLLGINYIPLRREFWDVASKVRRQEVEDVLVVFGAQDIRGLTDSTLAYLVENFPNYTYHVVQALNSAGSEKRFESVRTKFYRDLSASEILRLMLSCDLAISAAGQTTYELARLGVPTIAIGVAENQRNNIRGWKDVAFVTSEIWYSQQNFLENIGDSFSALLPFDARVKFGKMTQLCDGQGARRIVKELISENTFSIQQP